MDKFFIQKHCDHCGANLENGRIMSRFNTDCICLECSKKEKDKPGYDEAVDVEIKEVKKGNYNYPGING